MTIDVQLTFQSLFGNILSEETHNPDNPHDVIHMLVGNENISDLPPVNIRIFQLFHNSIAATTINQKIMTIFFNGETGVIAFGDHSVPSA